MIPVHPTSLWKYLGKRKHSVREGIGHQFYLSWEDSLWDILRSYKIRESSIVLIPSFFCMDVVGNMKTHGLHAVFYNLDKNLQANQKEVTGLIKLHNPKIIIIFHPVGMRSLLLDSKELLRFLSSDTILIEDAVHQLVNPQKIEIKRKNHFILTSLRKVVPLQGSVVFGKKEDIQKLKGAGITDVFYILKVLFYWVLMQLLLTIQKYFPINRVKIISGKKAEHFMLKGYDVIGDSYLPASCPNVFFQLYLHLNFENIEKVKTLQVNRYRKKLSSHSGSSVIKPVSFHEKNDGKLRGFPIRMHKKKADEIIGRIRQEGIYLRKELEGCIWTDNYSVAYLPLGPHLSMRHIDHIADKVNDASHAFTPLHYY